MGRETRLFVTLDGLRGVAAFAVVLTHGGMASPFEVARGFLAVDFFFALSGFVLAHAYTERLRMGMTPRTFLLIRLARLYPLYILGSTIGILIVLSGDRADGLLRLSVEIAAALLFLPSPVSMLLFPFNFPAWSLFWELVTNCMFAAFSNRLNDAFLFVAVAIMAGIIVAYAIWLGTLDTSNGWLYFEGGFLRSSFSFFAGVFTYRVWQKRPSPANLPALVLAAILLLLLAIPGPQYYSAAFEASLVVLVFPVLIWLGASSKPGWPVALACSWLGEISYAVYALHVPILGGARLLHMSRIPARGFVLLFIIVVAADLATRFFDRPVRHRLMSWLGLDRHRPESVAAGAIVNGLHR